MRAVISATDLGKRYQLAEGGAGTSPYRTLRDDLLRWASAPGRLWRRWGRRPGNHVTPAAGDFWALSKIHFDIRPGEAVGVIGRNGAGKSTLLKILSRITKPTTGRVELNGRVGSLLEVGTGFHPEMTGRENVFLNGVLLGMSRREVLRKFDDIVAFAEVDRFLDTPVKRYSSGMYVRLAFAVAAHLDPEVLIVDEVLAVGDAAFQARCLGKMHSLAGSGRTVLFVSHNMPAVRALTGRCLYLHRGRIAADGPTAAVIDAYLKDAWEARAGEGAGPLDYYRRDRGRPGPVRIERLWVTGGDGGTPPTLASGEDFTVHCQFTAERAYPRSYSGWWLSNQRGERVATFFNPDAGHPLAIRPGTQAVACRVRSLPLAPGAYTVSFGLNEGVTSVAWDVIVDYPAFRVVLPQAESGELEWPGRPWGTVHWPNTSWYEEGTAP
jgi:lipopolysaccharide transport system ATP-binding protein